MLLKGRDLARLAGLLAGVLLCAATAQAADYYVRTDGSDGCNGRAVAPAGSGSCAFRTIAKANASAGVGDQVHIGGGEFYEGRSSL